MCIIRKRVVTYSKFPSDCFSYHKKIVDFSVSMTAEELSNRLNNRLNQQNGQKQLEGPFCFLRTMYFWLFAPLVLKPVLRVYVMSKTLIFVYFSSFIHSLSLTCFFLPVIRLIQSISVTQFMVIAVG